MKKTVKKQIGSRSVFSPELEKLPNNLPVEVNHSTWIFSRNHCSLLLSIRLLSRRLDPYMRPTDPPYNSIILAIAQISLIFRTFTLNSSVEFCKLTATTCDMTRRMHHSLGWPCFVNNSLHSLFSDCTVSAIGFKVFSSNYH